MGVQHLKYQLLLLLVLFCIKTNAQECEWIEVGIGNKSEFSFSVEIDNFNNKIICGSFNDTFSITNFGQTFNFTKKTPPSPSNIESNALLIKYDNTGKIIWAQQSERSTPASSCFYREITIDTKGDIYISAEIKGTIDFGNGTTVSSVDTFRSDLAIVKYNANGVAQWARIFNPQPAFSNFTFGGRLTADNDDNVIFCFSYRGTINIANTSQTIVSGVSNQNDIAIVKYSSSGVFLNSLSIGGVASESSINIKSDINNNIFIFFDSPASITVGSSTFADTGICLLKLNPNLGLIRGKKFISQSSFFNSYGVAVGENGECAFSGLFRDTITFGGVGLASTASGTRSSVSINTYITYLDSNFNTKWVKQGEGVSTSSAAAPLGGTAIRNGFIYFGGQFQGSDVIWDKTLTMKFVPTAPNLYIAKMDTLGNFLWAFGGGASGSQNDVRSVKADLEGNGIITGTFNTFVNVLNKSVSGNSSVNFFTAKIVDYSITRGNVSSGPYCAGDSFDIPYTKTGTYDTGNVFIAQLSDSAGNFDGGERELGRLTDTAAGTIKGSLPLFDVASTDKYRIRIISTKPVVQSFFRRDSLRLLIYSKDTANAGPDFWVCKKQAVNLGTTGGSKWQWSPNTYFVNSGDTNNRSPLIAPDSTIEYRIIISDSSGCGLTDTDYVKIFVRPAISFGISGQSASCRGQQVTLKASATGGDSTYWYQWRIKDSTAVFSTLDSISVSPQNTTTYMLIAGDSCTPKIDTLLFSLQIDTVLIVTTNADTIICKGATAQLRAYGSGCDTAKYRFVWADSTDTATVLGTQAFFSPTPTLATTYRVVLRDISTSLSDTAFVHVGIDTIFKASVGTDSTICKGQSVLLTANSISCDTSQLQYQWNNGLGAGKTKTVSPKITTTYKVVITNTFNGLKDSAQIKITVRDSLKITLNKDTTICIGEKASLRATATGGKNTSYQIQWLDSATNLIVSANTASLQVSPIKTTTYKAILSDGCTGTNDSAFVKVTVRDSLKIKLPYKDTAICTGQTFTISAGGKGGNSTNYRYLWTLPNATTLNQPTLSRTPTTSGTYVLTLKDNNCTNYTDTAKVFVFVRDPLDVIANGKTEACFGETIRLSAFTKGGDSSQYKFTWVYPNGQRDTGKSINVTPDSASLYKLIVEDNCSTPAKDSAQILLTVPDPIRVLTAKDTILCLGWVLPVQTIITGGNPAKYKISWQGMGISPTDTNSNITIQNLPPGKYQYIIDVTDNCALAGKDTVVVEVLSSPTASFGISKGAGCPPLAVSITDVSQNHDSTLNIWRLSGVSGAQVQQVPSPQFILPQSGLYSLFLKVSNSLGCTDSATLTNSIQVYQKPVADFRISPEFRQIDEPVSFINQSTNANSFVWFLGEGDSVATNNLGAIEKVFTDTGTFIIRLIAANSFGCNDTFERLTSVSDPFTYFIPNAFTPISSAGLNDGFAPVNTGTKTYSMTIFDRWGEVIYDCDCDEGCNQPCTWNGNYKGETLPMGIYSYIIRFRTGENRKKTVWGTVYLIR